MSSSSMLPLPTGFAPALRTTRARVETVLDGRRVELLLHDGTRRSAALAAYGYDDPRVGDEVLSLLDGDEAYVVGVLRALRDLSEGPDEVRDEGGRLLFRHDRSTGTSEVFVPEGDLKLRAEAGRLDLEARDGVHLTSDDVVDVRAGRRVEIGAGGDVGTDDGATSTLLLTSDRVGASAPELLLAAGRATLTATDLGLAADTLQLTAKRLKNVARVVETRAHRLVERTRDSSRVVERLAELKTGRLTTIAREGVRVVGQRVRFQARGKMKIQGEKIDLG